MLAVDLLKKVLPGLKPPENLTLTEWFGKNVAFSSTASRKSGAFDPTFAPFQKGIMDCATDPRYEEIVVLKSGQSGVTTTVLAGMMLYSIFQEPAHILYVRPSNEDVQKFSKKELKNLLDGSPRLKGFFKENKGKESSNTIKQKLFPGGSLTMVGSGSAGALAGFSCKICLLDEVSKFKPIAGCANVTDLAKTRTKTYADYGRKIIYVSTPEVSGVDEVESLYFEKSDMREWFCPCPYCETFQVLKWGNVKYGHCKDTLDDLYIECIDCHKHISELQRMPMVRKGEWRITNHDPARKDFPGFWFSDLISPFSSLKNIVKAWLDIGMDQLKLKNFINEVLGEAWKEEIRDKISEEKLYNRREKYPAPVPYGVGMLTMGVDVQDDRLEYSVYGWGAGDETWLIEHKIILGSPGLDEVWETLDGAIWKGYQHESGAGLLVERVCIDSGHFTSRVYNFCHGKGPKVVCIKGQGGAGVPLIPAKAVMSGPRHTKRFDLGTDAIKDQVYAYLNNKDEGPGYVHFPEHADPEHGDYDLEFFKQITSEVPSYRYVSGQKTRYYKQIRARNEAIDTYCYAYAGFKMANFNNVLSLRLEQLKYVPQTEPDPTEITQQETVIEPQATPLPVQPVVKQQYLYDIPQPMSRRF